VPDWRSPKFFWLFRCLRKSWGQGFRESALMPFIMDVNPFSRWCKHRMRPVFALPPVGVGSSPRWCRHIPLVGVGTSLRWCRQSFCRHYMVVLPPKHGIFGGKTTVIWRQIFAVRGQGASLRGWSDAETSGRKGAGASAKPPILVWSQCLKGRIPGHSASSHSDCRRKSTPFHAANTFQSQYIVSANYGRADDHSGIRHFSAP